VSVIAVVYGYGELGPMYRKKKEPITIVLALSPNCASRLVTLSDTEKKSIASQVQASNLKSNEQMMVGFPGEI
jgi:hypothetical protein